MLVLFGHLLLNKTFEGCEPVVYHTFGRKLLTLMLLLMMCRRSLAEKGSLFVDPEICWVGARK